MILFANFIPIILLLLLMIIVIIILLHIKNYIIVLLLKVNSLKEENFYLYYFLKFKFFDTAVIIHDSVFINSKIDFNINDFIFLWHFEHDWDQIPDETNMIKSFNDSELTKFYQNKSLWKGCFGAMSIIQYDYLKFVNDKYNLDLLIPLITSRFNRCSFERVIACLLFINSKNNKFSLFGDIHKYSKWGIDFFNKHNYKHLPIIKIWSGR